MRSSHPSIRPHARSMGLLLASLAGLAASAAAQTIEYHATNLGKVPGSYLSYPKGLNDAGTVVGMGMYIPGGLKAWTWDATQGYAVLPQPPGISDYSAVAINDAGVIAGDGGGDGGQIWRYTNGSYEMLGFLSGMPIPRTRAINASGSIVGTCHGTLFYNPRHSFLAVPGATMASALANSEANGINDAGQIVGKQGLNGYRLTGSTLELMPALGNRIYSAALDVNDFGHVVGWAKSSLEHSDVPFLFTDAAGIQEIGDLGGRAFARAVNDLDEVVGEWEPLSVRIPWVWSPQRGLRQLNDVHDGPMNLRHVWDINDRGQILCDSYFNGEYVGVLLTPVCHGVVPFGEDVGGANVGSLSSASSPVVGGTVTFDLQGFTAGPAPGLVVVSTRMAQLPFAGGTLLVDLGGSLEQLPFVYGTSASVSTSIPNDPALAGTRGFAQAGVFHPSSQTFELSNGLSVTVCP